MAKKQRKNSVAVNTSRQGEKIDFVFSQNITERVRREGDVYYILDGNQFIAVPKGTHGAHKFQTSKPLGAIEVWKSRVANETLRGLKKKTLFKCHYNTVSGTITMDLMDYDTASTNASIGYGFRRPINQLLLESHSLEDFRSRLDRYVVKLAVEEALEEHGL